MVVSSLLSWLFLVSHAWGLLEVYPQVRPVNLFSPDGTDPRKEQIQTGAGKTFAPIGLLINRGEERAAATAASPQRPFASTATLVSPCYILATAHGVFGSEQGDFAEVHFRSIGPDGKGM